MSLEKRQRIGHATLRQVVVEIVPPILVHDALTARYELLHFGELRPGADAVRAGLDDQRRTTDLVHLIREVRIGPRADETLEKREIVLAHLAEHPFDQA